jgi:putative transposase
MQSHCAAIQDSWCDDRTISMYAENIGMCSWRCASRVPRAVPEVCRELGISTATFYQWRSRYGGMDTSMMARLKELEEENRRLKKMYADERLKAEIVSEALAKKW